jgi:hypothetical protein
VLYLALARLLSRNLRQAHVSLSRGVHVVVSDLRDEFLGLPRLVDDAVELVDLLEGETLGFVDHEVARMRISVCHRWCEEAETYTKAMQTKQNVPQTKKTLL